LTRQRPAPQRARRWRGAEGRGRRRGSERFASAGVCHGREDTRPGFRFQAPCSIAGQRQAFLCPITAASIAVGCMNFGKADAGPAESERIVHHAPRSPGLRAFDNRQRLQRGRVRAHLLGRAIGKAPPPRSRFATKVRPSPARGASPRASPRETRRLRPRGQPRPPPHRLRRSLLPPTRPTRRTPDSRRPLEGRRRSPPRRPNKKNSRPFGVLQLRRLADPRRSWNLVRKRPRRGRGPSTSQKCSNTCSSGRSSSSTPRSARRYPIHTTVLQPASRAPCLAPPLRHRTPRSPKASRFRDNAILLYRSR